MLGRFGTIPERSPVAQLVEQVTVNHRVGGSSPSRGAIFRPCPMRLLAPSPSPVSSPHLCADIFADLCEMRGDLCEALSQFARIPPSMWFREVLLCILTPQSSPYHAEAAMVQLEERGFFCGGLSEDEVAEVLRTPAQYVRFHRVKAVRLLRAREQRDAIDQLLSLGLSPREERDKLRALVCGLGMKEASHALRNIGRCGLAILDRHILRALCDCGMLSEMPRSISDRRYRELESLFLSLADQLQESPDILDLYLWARATGSVFK